MHPRTAHVVRDAGLTLPAGDVLRAIEPLGYLDMIALVAHARIVLTDSGGLQKEAFFLGRPCVTLREETEWVETVTGGGNVLAGTAISRIRDAVSAWEAALAAGEPDFTAAVSEAFGAGDASARIVELSLEFAEARRRVSLNR
jgi:UDP-N-acetylglucosamine 2-epimerase